MTIEEGLQAYLSTKAAVVAISGTRVFPIYPPQELMTGRTDNYPCITYQVISDAPVHSMSGHCNLTYKRIQVTAWGRTYKAAKDLAELVRMASDGYAGTMGSVTVQSCLKEGGGETDFDLSVGNVADRIFGASADYMIGFTEAVPTL